jgi:hypothetical protein
VGTRRDYGRDVLAGDWKAARRPPPPPEIPAERGLVVETLDGRFCGAVVICEKRDVTLEDRFGKQRVFPLDRGAFLLEGRRVTLVRPAVAPGRVTGGAAGGAAGGSGARAGRTASGSVAAPSQRAKVAQASRIYVEGRHDAELAEKIWGDDLRDVGVVVEYLEGVDHLPDIVAGFSPGPGRRLGVLVDHLVDGSKESRIAAQVSSPYVLVAGHPFIDIWEAVKPSALGIAAWPSVPRGEQWKDGVLRRLGWPPDTAAAWRRILRAARSYTDLEPELLGTVEHLIDFVTSPDNG